MDALNQQAFEKSFLENLDLLRQEYPEHYPDPSHPRASLYHEDALEVVAEFLEAPGGKKLYKAVKHAHYMHCNYTSGIGFLPLMTTLALTQTIQEHYAPDNPIQHQAEKISMIASRALQLKKEPKDRTVYSPLGIQYVVMPALKEAVKNPDNDAEAFKNCIRHQSQVHRSSVNNHMEEQLIAACDVSSLDIGALFSTNLGDNDQPGRTPGQPGLRPEN